MNEPPPPDDEDWAMVDGGGPPPPDDVVAGAAVRRQASQSERRTGELLSLLDQTQGGGDRSGPAPMEENEDADAGAAAGPLVADPDEGCLPWERMPPPREPAAAPDAATRMTLAAAGPDGGNLVFLGWRERRTEGGGDAPPDAPPPALPGSAATAALLRRATSGRGLLSRPVGDLLAEVEARHAARARQAGAAAARAAAAGAGATTATGPTAPGPSPSAAAAASVPRDNKSSSLWVDAYAPKSYATLISSEAGNRAVLAWLRCWDGACRPGGRPPPEAVQRLGGGAGESAWAEPGGHHHARGTGADDDGPDAPWRLGPDGLPRRRLLLLSGPPGAGKSTLALVAAAAAGFRAHVVDASSERTRGALERRVRDAAGSRHVGGDARPVCVVLEEADGLFHGGGGGQGAAAALVALARGGGGGSGGNGGGTMTPGGGATDDEGDGRPTTPGRGPRTPGRRTTPGRGGGGGGGGLRTPSRRGGGGGGGGPPSTPSRRTPTRGRTPMSPAVATPSLDPAARLAAAGAAAPPRTPSRPARPGARAAAAVAGALLRPIVLICNDPTAPALRPLLRSGLCRHLALPAPSVGAVASRLAAVARREGVRVEPRVPAILARRAGGDIRAALHALQLLSRDAPDGNGESASGEDRRPLVTAAAAARAHVPGRDAGRAAADLLDGVFHLPLTAGTLGAPLGANPPPTLHSVDHAGGAGIGAARSAPGDAGGPLWEAAVALGDPLPLAGAAFGHLPSALGTDGGVARRALPAAEALSELDCLVGRGPRGRSGAGHLFAPGRLLALRAVAAGVARHRIKASSRVDVDAARREAAHRATLKAWALGAGPGSRATCSSRSAALDAAPTAVWALCPKARAVDPSLFSDLEARRERERGRKGGVGRARWYRETAPAAATSDAAATAAVTAFVAATAAADVSLCSSGTICLPVLPPTGDSAFIPTFAPPFSNRRPNPTRPLSLACPPDSPPGGCRCGERRAPHDSPPSHPLLPPPPGGCGGRRSPVRRGARPVVRPRLSCRASPTSPPRGAGPGRPRAAPGRGGTEGIDGRWPPPPP